MGNRLHLMFFSFPAKMYFFTKNQHYKIKQFNNMQQGIVNTFHV